MLPQRAKHHSCCIQNFLNPQRAIKCYARVLWDLESGLRWWSHVLGSMWKCSVFFRKLMLCVKSFKLIPPVHTCRFEDWHSLQNFNKNYSKFTIGHLFSLNLCWVHGVQILTSNYDSENIYICIWCPINAFSRSEK
jgi:hypothetical protein